MTLPAPSPSGTFDWLIAPVKEAEFAGAYHERGFCVVRRGDPDYYGELLTVQDLDVVLGTHKVRPPDINVVRGEDTIPRGAFTLESGVIDPLGVAKLFDEGATVTFNQLQHRIPALGELCAVLAQVFSSRLQTNTYLTPPGAQGFRPHWDTHDVFILQVSGRKHWRLFQGPAELPLRGQAFDPNRDSAGPVTAEFELHPGDAAYIPRGFMHSARSSAEASLHITLGITAATWTDFLVESVAAAALRESSLRQALPLRFAANDFPVDTRRRLFQEKLSILVSQLDPSEVWQRFATEMRAVNTPLFTDLLTTRVDGNGVTGSSRWRKRRGIAVEFRSSADGCVLRFGGKEMTFPALMLEAVEFLASAEAFTVSDLPSGLDEDRKRVLVERLFREGLLQHEPENAPGH